jgi:hypothetical protein
VLGDLDVVELSAAVAVERARGAAGGFRRADPARRGEGVAPAHAARDASKVKPLVVSKGLTYTILLDPQTTVVAQFNPSKTLPYNVLVDRAGNIDQVFSGYNPGDEVKLKAAVERLLAAPAK